MYKIIIKLKFLINYYYLKPQERSQSTLWSYDTNVDITAEKCSTCVLFLPFFYLELWCLLTCWIILESFGRFSLGGTFPNNFQPGALWTAGLSSFVLLVKKFLKWEEGFCFAYYKHMNKVYCAYLYFFHFSTGLPLGWTVKIYCSANA